MKLLYCISICLLITAHNSCVNPSKGGYLFAHMLASDYGHLYYSISRDGQNWILLNDSKRIDPIYRGHPDICMGADGYYYMIGAEKSPANPVLWRSEDLVSWIVARHLPDSLFIGNTTGYNANQAWYGAPKMFFDEASMNYLITWHAPETDIDSGDEMWKSMRTFYTLSPDFERFTKPQRLFNFDDSDEDMATIDVIIRKAGSTYFAIIKDERWPEDTRTGKTIRIALSANLTGPYGEPGSPVTPAWFEAPSIVPSPNGRGWYMYAENYPNRYMLFQTDSLLGTWSAIDINLEGVRHGCVIRINEDQYSTLTSAFSR